MPRLRRALLLASAPLWLGPYLLLGLAGLCADGLAFVVEEYTGRPLPSGRAFRSALALPALVLFPLAITAETTALFLGLVGALPAFLAVDAGLAAAVGGLVARATWGTALVVPGTLGALGVTLGVLGLGWMLRPVSGVLHALVAAAAGAGWGAWALGHGAADPLAGALRGGGVGALAGLAAAVAVAVVGRRLSIPFYEGTRPSGHLGKSAAALAGIPGIALAPLWMPYFLVLWLLRELLHGVLVRDVERSLSGASHHPLVPAVAGQARRFEAFVGLRYLRGKKNQGYLSAITLISILGVTVGVWALDVVLSVMGGFERDLRDKILGANAHAVVMSYTGEIADHGEVRRKLLEVPGVVDATPFKYTELMLKNHDKVTGAILKGVDVETVGGVTSLVADLKQGMGGLLADDAARRDLLDRLDEPMPPQPDRVIPDPDAAVPGIVLGEELARTLHVYPGDVLTAISPVGGEPGPFGAPTTPVARFRVKAIFYSGMWEYDTKWAYVTLATAQRFLRTPDVVTAFEVRVDDIDGADDIATAIEQHLGYPFWTRDWMSLNRNLFSALKLEKVVMGIILTFIVMVAALNIISTLIMVVIEKGKEIAILKAMGASGVRVMKVFMIEGLIIGFIGTTTGTILGWGSCWLLDRYKFIKLDTDVYYLDTLPVEISPPLFALVALVALGVSFSATIYPSWQASNLDPVEGLRYE